MSKRIFCVVMVALLSTAAFAQSGRSAKEIRQDNFVFGPKVGISMPYQNIVTNTTALSSMLGAANLGYQLGGYMRGILPIKKSKFSLYMQLDATWANDFYFGGGGNASAGCFNFPLMLGGGYKLSKDVTLRAAWGPTYTINIYTTANTAFKDADNKYQKEVAEMLNRDPWGWAADLGMDWKCWTIDLRYMNQFRSLENFIRIADETRYISIGLTVGYRF